MQVPTKHMAMKLLFTIVLSLSYCDNNFLVIAADINPYKVLQVAPKASTDDIRRQYRKLCLKYHPDKNVNASDRERNNIEKKFKEIQSAYGMIGDQQSRSSYDRSRTWQGAHSAFNKQFGSGASHNMQHNFFRFGQAFSTGSRKSNHRQQHYDHRANMNAEAFRKHEQMNGVWPFLVNQNSIFVQPVTLSLEELFEGRHAVEVELKSSLWSRSVAACRGGLAPVLLLQAFMYTLPFRFSKALSMVVFSLSFKALLPTPPQKLFFLDIQKGFKGGTKMKFKRPGMEAVFILKESSHTDFRREGNDLHTSVKLTKAQAKLGCQLKIPTLGNEDEVLRLKIDGPVEASYIERIPHKGWHNRKTGTRGDLVVRIEISPSLFRRKSRDG